MDIAIKINQEQIKVITERGYEPKFVYLGKVELSELIDWAMEEYGFEKRPESSDGLEFLSLKILEVNTNNHLNVA